MEEKHRRTTTAQTNVSLNLSFRLRFLLKYMHQQIARIPRPSMAALMTISQVNNGRGRAERRLDEVYGIVD